jgi:hypothetical protein
VYDPYRSVAGWMIAGGNRIDEPDLRYLEHLTAIREAKRSMSRPFAPFAWIGERLGTRSQAPVPCQLVNCSPAT